MFRIQPAPQRLQPMRQQSHEVANNTDTSATMQSAQETQVHKARGPA